MEKYILQKQKTAQSARKPIMNFVASCHALTSEAKCQYSLMLLYCFSYNLSGGKIFDIFSLKGAL